MNRFGSCTLLSVRLKEPGTIQARSHGFCSCPAAAVPTCCCYCGCRVSCDKGSFLYSYSCSGRGGGDDDDAAVGVYGEFLSISESLLFMSGGVSVADHPPPAPCTSTCGVVVSPAPSCIGASSSITIT